MIKETVDPLTGDTYPAYGFYNREEYLPIQQKGCAKILYGIKANAQLNSDMHSALYQKVYSGHMKFLISEQQAKNKIIATRRGQRMSPEAVAARLLPHDLTTIMINEIMNLKIRNTGVNNQIAVELINERMLKDKFSALEMGVYRVVQMENEAMSRRRNRGLGQSRMNLTFATGGSSKRMTDSSRLQLRGGVRRRGE